MINIERLKRDIYQYGLVAHWWRESSKPRESNEYREMRNEVNRRYADICDTIDKLVLEGESITDERYRE